MSTPAPKKYVKVNGVTTLNPAWKAWKEGQTGGQPATTVAIPAQALPIVSNMDDYMTFNEDMVMAGGTAMPLSDSTNATIEIMQEPEICVEAGMTADTMVDELGAILNKYEVPMGLMNKLMMLSEFDSMEFIIDDSGSMSLQTDALDAHGRLQTRWQEAQGRVKEMVEILAYLPFQSIDITFLNRQDNIKLLRNGRDPKSFLSDAYNQIDRVFTRGPSGTTPALEKFQMSLIEGRGKSIARYFFGDGTPNGGLQAQQEIVRILCSRENPSSNPVTFLSCTSEDDQVEWMKDAEEVVPYCSESDDFQDESREVLLDQGAALPYSKGFHIICQLVAAMNPDDLDAMDESVPLSKRTLDNILGIQQDETNYRHYFTCFQEAQRKRPVHNKVDQLKKNQNWNTNYQEFLTVPVANQIPAVKQFKIQLTALQ